MHHAALRDAGRLCLWSRPHQVNIIKHFHAHLGQVDDFEIQICKGVNTQLNTSGKTSKHQQNNGKKCKSTGVFRPFLMTLWSFSETVVRAPDFTSPAREKGSNLGPSDLKSSTLPLRHCDPLKNIPLSYRFIAAITAYASSASGLRSMQ